MPNQRKPILRRTCAALAAAAVCAAVSQLWYLPHYRAHQTPVEANADGNGICVMSANVRCYSPTDLGRKSWLYRADLLLRDVAAEQPDVIGFQEVTALHYRYLTRNLQGYASVIAYRDRSLLSEGCPVFYNTLRFTLRDKGSFWLSETPERSSKDWGAAFPRVCSYVILTENATGRDFVVFNTHLDHVSDEARIRGIGVVLDKLRQFGDLPCVFRDLPRRNGGFRRREVPHRRPAQRADVSAFRRCGGRGKHRLFSHFQNRHRRFRLPHRRYNVRRCVSERPLSDRSSDGACLKTHFRRNPPWRKPFF